MILDIFKKQSITPLDLLFNFFTIIWWLEIGKRIDFLGKIRIEFLIGSILVSIAAVRINQGLIRIFNPISKAIFGYLGILLFSLPFSVDMTISWDIYFNRVVKFSMMAFFMMVFIRNVFQLKLFFVSSFIAFFKVGQEAFYGKISGNMVWQSQGVMRLHGTQETMFGHPNSLSGKFVGLFPFIWYFFPVIDRKWKILLSILIIFLINILIFTASRMGYISFLLALLFISLDSKRKIKSITLLIAIFCFSAVIVPEQYQERFLSSFTGEDKEGGSSRARKDLFFDSLQVFSENPFGVGINGFIVVQKRHGRNAQDTHNLYTQILSETGIQGFIAFCWLITVIFKQNKLCKNELISIKAKIEYQLQSGVKLDSYQVDIESFRNDVIVLSAICKAIQFFLIIRLVLGVFGHDLYEIYWWIAAGTVMAMHSCIRNIIQDFEKLSS